MSRVAATESFAATRLMTRITVTTASRPWLHSVAATRLGIMKGKTWIRWMLYWIFWTVLGLLNAATQIIQNPGAPTWKPLLWELSSLYTVGALYPLVANVSRRYPVSK